MTQDGIVPRPYLVGFKKEDLDTVCTASLSDKGNGHDTEELEVWWLTEMQYRQSGVRQPINKSNKITFLLRRSLR